MAPSILELKRLNALRPLGNHLLCFNGFPYGETCESQTLVAPVKRTRLVPSTPSGGSNQFLDDRDLYVYDDVTGEEFLLKRSGKRKIAHKKVFEHKVIYIFMFTKFTSMYTVYTPNSRPFRRKVKYSFLAGKSKIRTSIYRNNCIVKGNGWVNHSYVIPDGFDSKGMETSIPVRETRGQKGARLLREQSTSNSYRLVKVSVNSNMFL